MKEFFELYDRQSNLALEIGHNSIADWNIVIYDRKGTTLENAKKIIHVQDCDYNLVIAKAYVDLCEYLSETRGGY